MAIETGRLRCVTEGSNKKKRTVVKLECQNPKKTKTVKLDLNVDWLSEPLQVPFKQSHQNLNDLDVEFERNENNDPFRIWEAGKQFEAKAVTTTPLVKEETVPDSQHRQRNKTGFHNPYNFIPALPRTGNLGELGNGSPIGHGCYHFDRWTGRITVKLTTITPLLIPDASQMTTQDNDHKTFPVRLCANGMPYLPPTSIKGMLRSAYEAITNSRLSIFVNHDERLAYRMPAAEGTIAKPARVEVGRNGLQLRILKTAKLSRYEQRSRALDKGAQRVGLKYQLDGQLPQHGDRVRIKLSKNKVTQIEQWNTNNPVGNDWKLGWVCVTGANIGGKENERVFFEDGTSPIIEVNAAITELWKTLISNYQAIHKKELAERDRNQQNPWSYLGHRPGETAWSRHIYDEGQRTLQEGILCYVELRDEPDDGSTNIPSNDVIALQPVTISRRLYSEKPINLLPDSLRPASDKHSLSPADRVFGWVNQNGHGSYKGHIRLHSVMCQTPKDNAISIFNDPGIPLAILGEPKPAQTRFYTAEDKSGAPINSKAGAEKEYGYSSQERGLRGRKVYPHHGELPSDYWEKPWEDRTNEATDGRYQAYRHPSGDKERNSQNRSVTGWVNVATEFTFNIDVSNLSDIELGALLWLLQLPENSYHRLGGGKPLGFGSVKLELGDVSDLRKGQCWKDFYTSLNQDSSQTAKSIDVSACIKQYQEAVVSTYGKDFDNVPFIAAFLRCAKGFEDGLPVHYPRNPERGGQPDPDGENFQWFTDNEQGDRWSLPSLASSDSLPFQPRSTEKVAQGKATPTISAALERGSATSDR